MGVHCWRFCPSPLSFTAVYSALALLRVEAVVVHSRDLPSCADEIMYRIEVLFLTTGLDFHRRNLQRRLCSLRVVKT